MTIDPVTKEFTYGDWEATNGTTLAGKAVLPVVTGYVATGDVDSSKKDVENVTATDNDITENVVYKAVGKYVPVIPDGITPPANTNVDPKPYTNDPQDGSKVKDPDPTEPSGTRNNNTNRSTSPRNYTSRARWKTIETS